MDECEIVAAVIEPHFEAIRVRFIEHEISSDEHMLKLLKTKFVVLPEVHDSERHFARCRTDGLLIEVAPEIQFLPHDQLMAILSHELGHAADFLYPGSWVTEKGKRAIWIGSRDDRPARKWRSMWHERSVDQIEWAADAIAYAVLDKAIEYCGPCMVQCFGGGQARPAGLR